MIEITGLSCTYRTATIETTAVNKISFTINKGEFVGIVGPSGSGKSTLLNVLGMLDSPDDGSYKFNDQEISAFSESKLSDLRKSNIGFVFQSFNLVDTLSVYENIELPLLYLKLPSTERAERVNEMLKRFDLENRASHMPQQLSGGQQQRVAVARAVVIQPKVLLADEPTGNLDSKNGQDVMEMLLRLNKEGTTVIMVTHSETQLQYCSRVIRLFDGKLVSDESVQSVEKITVSKEGKAYA
ncbi:ABC transporter ATP-binding protein [Rheinheimera soli]|uniref:ABC transport system ATP-binding protein n=1 Tax=Rheinheimera soli TaxID=443616 RepID=A0ABU1W571_9GAMM|nr:ABC transporter ATP-binding protein [Rheinheimera soli]MDR7123086.1 putative ABC transport system ATP-binding protein [Rheinheimera soli]